MELKPTEFCYNIYINNNDPCKYGIFYIGNGDIFIKGTTYILHGENDKVKLELTFINSSYSYNIDYIVSNSYEQIDIDYIIYNKMLKITEGNDMSYIPNCPILHEKINYVYNKEIFNLSELNFILDI